jgi:hypothetical protein
MILVVSEMFARLADLKRPGTTMYVVEQTASSVC